ncbi:hypothetical protein ACFSQ7_03970 [Paenibacillus rhizoplanae]
MLIPMLVFMAGANSADMGLMYDDSVGIGNAEKGWKPAIQINGSTTNASFEAPYNQVQSANAYMAGSQVTFFMHGTIIIRKSV